MQRKWRNKLAAGFTVSGSPSGDKLGADNVNRLGSYLGVMAQAGQESPTVSPPPEDHLTARELGRRVAEFSVRLQSTGQKS